MATIVPETKEDPDRFSGHNCMKTTNRCLLIEHIFDYINRYKKNKVAHEKDDHILPIRTEGNKDIQWPLHRSSPSSAPLSYHEPNPSVYGTDPETIRSKIKSIVSLNKQSGTSISSKQMTIESALPSWKAPPFNGLRNSPRIITEYYTSTNLKNGILKINYYDMIIDDIRNLRPLSSYQMKYIRKKLTPVEYNNIIYEYNQVMQVYLESYLLSSP